MLKAQRDEDLGVVSLLDEPVRRRLYDWVVAQAHPVGREEAAKATGVTRALAAFHLDKLAGAGLLDAGYQRLSGRTGPGAGRPARVYSRASREFSVSVPDRKYERAAQLFASALEKIGDGPVPGPLRAAARELGESIGTRAAPRIASKRLMAALEAGGYEPQADETGTIRLRNCPFDALAQQHRSLVCGTNLALAEGITRGVGTDDWQPLLDPQPGYCCVTFVPGTAAEPNDRARRRRGAAG
jgi:predicted ArsR family transcriptional regulator